MITLIIPNMPNSLSMQVLLYCGIYYRISKTVHQWINQFLSYIEFESAVPTEFENILLT